MALAHLEAVVDQPVERGRGVLHRELQQHRVGVLPVLMRMMSS
jgi:hypothetical protein